ncbi:hypothetical protein HDU80_002892 [Chytriomyces hyalinus]|nr:hypothetical protein HDU80_002892 [Chytriomyces hyalinus]
MLITPKGSKHKIPNDTIDEWHYKDMLALQEKSAAHTSKILPVPTTRKQRHPIVMAGPALSRPVSRTIILWILGRICNHQVCRKCGEVLSRQHGAECTGIEHELQLAFEGTLGPTPDLTATGATIIDEAISKLVFKDGSMPRIKATYKAINKVRLECSRYSEIIDASSATLQQELDAIFSEYEGPHHIRVQATAIMSATFNPTNFKPTHCGRSTTREPT